MASPGRPSSQQESAGLLMHRHRAGRLQVLLAHPGGPYFRNKDADVWTLPKGEIEPGDDLLATARREFREETGHDPAGPFLALGSIRQRGGKVVHAWACAGDLDDAAAPPSNLFEIEWPPASGRRQEFPEIDRVAWLEMDDARRRINPAQVTLLDRLVERLRSPA